MTLQERVAEVQVTECTDIEALKSVTLKLMVVNRMQKLLLMQYASRGL